MHRYRQQSRGLLLPFMVCASLCAVLCGCSDDKEVSYKSGGMTHTVAQGADALQKQFPLPIYPNSTPNGSVSAQGDENEQSKMLLLTTSDSIEKVSEYYQAEMPKGGWSVDNVQQTTPKLITISGAMKDKKLESNVTINDEFHLSLSKTIVLHHHWIEPFIQSLKTAFRIRKRLVSLSVKPLSCEIETWHTYLSI